MLTLSHACGRLKCLSEVSSVTRFNMTTLFSAANLDCFLPYSPTRKPKPGSTTRNILQKPEFQTFVSNVHTCNNRTAVNTNRQSPDESETLRVITIGSYVITEHDHESSKTSNPKPTLILNLSPPQKKHKPLNPH